VFLDAYKNMDNDTLNLALLHAFCHQMSFLPYACEKNRTHLKHWAYLTLTRVIDEIKKR
jgi:hypothetical protein